MPVRVFGSLAPKYTAVQNHDGNHGAFTFGTILKVAWSICKSLDYAKSIK